MERTLGPVLGFIDLDNLSLKEREFLSSNYLEEDYSSEAMKEDGEGVKHCKVENQEEESEDKYKSYIFHELRKYLQLDTYEYIPMKISVEVEDPVIGKKVKELVEALEKTRAPEQFYLNKKEADEDAYFAEGYGLTMNEEQKKQRDDFFWGEDVEGLKERLRKEKLYP